MATLSQTHITQEHSKPIRIYTHLYSYLLLYARTQQHGSSWLHCATIA